MKLPTVRIRGVAHVGDLSKPRRTGHWGSYEGPGLSVSQTPDAWREIAAVGGPTWLLRRRDGTPGKFVDIHSLRQDEKRALLLRASALGLGTPQALWRATWYDDEFEDERFSDFDTREEAVEDAAGWPRGKVRKVVGWAPSQKLRRWWGRFFGRPLYLGEAEEQAMLATIAATTEYDGAWWRDRFDPAALSAPRGVIFPKAQRRWDRCVLDDPDRIVAPTCAPRVAIYYLDRFAGE